MHFFLGNIYSRGLKFLQAVHENFGELSLECGAVFEVKYKSINVETKVCPE